jgi:hypothetical protein
MEGLGSDRLDGAEAIAQFIGVPLRRAFYLCDRKLIPCGKEGGRVIASKTALREHYEKLTRRTPA